MVDASGTGCGTTSNDYILKADCNPVGSYGYDHWDLFGYEVVGKTDEGEELWKIFSYFNNRMYYLNFADDRAESPCTYKGHHAAFFSA